MATVRYKMPMQDGGEMEVSFDPDMDPDVDGLLERAAAAYWGIRRDNPAFSKAEPPPVVVPNCLPRGGTGTEKRS